MNVNSYCEIAVEKFLDFESSFCFSERHSERSYRRTRNSKRSRSSEESREVRAAKRARRKRSRSFERKPDRSEKRRSREADRLENRKPDSSSSTSSENQSTKRRNSGSSTSSSDRSRSSDRASRRERKRQRHAEIRFDDIRVPKPCDSHQRLGLLELPHNYPWTGTELRGWHNRKNCPNEEKWRTGSFKLREFVATCTPTSCKMDGLLVEPSVTVLVWIANRIGEE